MWCWWYLCLQMVHIALNILKLVWLHFESWLHTHTCFRWYSPILSINVSCSGMYLLLSRCCLHCTSSKSPISAVTIVTETILICIVLYMTHKCIHTYILYIHINMCMCNKYPHTYACLYVLYVFMHVCLYACMYACSIHTCTHTRIYVYVYMHTLYILYITLCVYI